MELSTEGASSNEGQAKTNTILYPDDMLENSTLCEYIMFKEKLFCFVKLIFLFFTRLKI